MQNSSENNKMKVSILVPYHNAATFIKKCAMSLFNQSYNNIEYIFVDDASNDETTEILKDTIQKNANQRKNIKILRNNINKGIAETRNILLKEAAGDYIYFVDSDDFIEEDAIKTFANTANKHNADIVRCCYRTISNNTAQDVIKNKIWKDKTELLRQAIGSNDQVDAMWKLFVRRELFTQHNLFFEQGINACEDYIMSVKLFYFANCIVDIPDCLYNYRIFENSNSISKKASSFITDMNKASDTVATFLLKQGVYDVFQKEIQQRIFISKQPYIINKKLFNIQKFLTIHPETNKMWRTFNYPLRERILFILAEYNLKYIIKLINYLH